MWVCICVCCWHRDFRWEVKSSFVSDFICAECMVIICKMSICYVSYVLNWVYQIRISATYSNICIVHFMNSECPVFSKIISQTVTPELITSILILVHLHFELLNFLPLGVSALTNLFIHVWFKLYVHIVCMRLFIACANIFNSRWGSYSYAI